MSDNTIAMLIGLIRDIDYYKLTFLAVLVFVAWIIWMIVKVLQDNTEAMTRLRESLDDLQTSTAGVPAAIAGIQQVLAALLTRLNIDLHELGVGEETLRRNGKNKEE